MTVDRLRISESDIRDGRIVCDVSVESLGSGVRDSVGSVELSLDTFVGLRELMNEVVECIVLTSEEEPDA